MIGECFIDALGAAKSVIAQNSIIALEKDGKKKMMEKKRKIYNHRNH